MTSQSATEISRSSSHKSSLIAELDWMISRLDHQAVEDAGISLEGEQIATSASSMQNTPGAENSGKKLDISNDYVNDRRPLSSDSTSDVWRTYQDFGKEELLDGHSPDESGFEKRVSKLSASQRDLVNVFLTAITGERVDGTFAHELAKSFSDILVLGRLHELKEMCDELAANASKSKEVVAEFDEGLALPTGITLESDGSYSLDADAKVLGNFFEHQRIKRRLSFRKAAERLGVKATKVQTIEQGVSTITSLSEFSELTGFKVKILISPRR